MMDSTERELTWKELAVSQYNVNRRNEITRNMWDLLTALLAAVYFLVLAVVWSPWWWVGVVLYVVVALILWRRRRRLKG